MFNEIDQHRVLFAFHPKSRKPLGCIRLQVPGFPTGKDVIKSDCVIDTGAAMTTIPERDWSSVVSKDQAINDFKFVPREGKGVGGGRIDVLEGKLPTSIFGPNLVESDVLDLGPCRIWLALDGLDPERSMKQALFGVGGGCMDKGGLCLNWRDNSGHYVEVTAAEGKTE